MPPLATRATLLPMKLDREQDRPHPLQVTLYRQATPTQKLAAVARLNATAIAMKDAALKSRFPGMPPETRRAVTRRWWLTARD